jgi:hypothetical protein
MAGQSVQYYEGRKDCKVTDKFCVWCGVASVVCENSNESSDTRIVLDVLSSSANVRLSRTALRGFC